MGFLDLITSKQSFISSGLLNGATDIHSHILPGVDDGVNNYNEAVQALQWLKNIGIGQVYLTPHIMSDFSKNTSGYLSEQFDTFIKRLENEGITNIPYMKLGAEYMLEADFEKNKKNGLLMYAGRHILMETSYLTPPLGFMKLLEDLLENGYFPVLAHPERYNYMELKDFVILKEQGVKFQLNFLSLTGAYGSAIKEKADQLLMEGFYDYTGSDIHRIPRQNNFFTAKKLTRKQILTLQPLFRNNRQLW